MKQVTRNKYESPSEKINFYYIFLDFCLLACWFVLLLYSMTTATRLNKIMRSHIICGRSNSLCFFLFFIENYQVDLKTFIKNTNKQRYIYELNSNSNFKMEN